MQEIASKRVSVRICKVQITIFHAELPIIIGEGAFPFKEDKVQQKGLGGEEEA